MSKMFDDLAVFATRILFDGYKLSGMKGDRLIASNGTNVIRTEVSRIDMADVLEIPTKITTVEDDGVMMPEQILLEGRDIAVYKFSKRQIELYIEKSINAVKFKN